MSWIKCNDTSKVNPIPPCVYSDGIGSGHGILPDGQMKKLHYIFCTKNQTYWLRNADRPCPDYVTGHPLCIVKEHPENCVAFLHIQFTLLSMV